MKTPTQIAAETLDKLDELPVDCVIERRGIIQVAIEEAYAQGKCDMAETAADKITEIESRAAHVSEHEFRFDVCQKCGTSAFDADKPCASKQGAWTRIVTDEVRLLANRPHFTTTDEEQKKIHFALRDLITLRDRDKEIPTRIIIPKRPPHT